MLPYLFHLSFMYPICFINKIEKKDFANKLKNFFTTLVWFNVEPTLWNPQIYHPHL